MTEDNITTRNDENLILVNVLEELVRREVNSEIKSFDMCDCERCRLNACAIALNALPPHYVTTTSGALFASVDTFKFEYQAKILVEVTKALMMVKEKPNH